MPDINLGDFASSPTPCICPSQQRSIWDIVWSCFATIFACAWVSVHPNVVREGEKWWKRTLLRVELMIWVLLTPELVLLWAMKQWYAARELANKYKGWTKTHGYFIQMGGFMLHRGGKPVEIIRPGAFARLLESGAITFPGITEDQINDRSKGDGLSKAIVIGQTTWLAAQCIARGLQGLEVTELELVTVAFALLNGAMYFFWWNKPLDVRFYVPVHEVEGTRTPVSIEAFMKPRKIRLSCRGSISSHVTKTYDVLINLRGQLFFLPDLVAQALRTRPSEALKSILSLPFRGLGALAWRLDHLITIDYCFQSLEFRRHYWPEQTHPFYAYFGLCGAAMEFSLWLSTATSTVAVIFGIIHCTGWHFVFPSPTESLLWRTASVLITATPLVMLSPVVLMHLQPGNDMRDAHVNRWFRDYLDWIIQVLACSGIFIMVPIYFVSRMYLLTEALISLRNLPPGAYDTVEWTTFIPHISNLSIT